MKTLFLLLFLSATTHYCIAQNNQFKKGQFDVQAGIGFISPLFENTKGYLTTSSKVPPLSATAEYAITDEISVGGYVATALSTVHFNTGAQSYTVGDIRHVIIGGRGLYHFDLLPSLDTYAGAMLGYNSVSTHDDGATTAQKSDLTYTVMDGARYRLAHTLGAFLELGYGVSIVNIGINLTFN